MSNEEKTFSRRKFLTGTLTVAAGALIGGCGTKAVETAATPPTPPPTGTPVSTQGAAPAGEAPALPWPYEPIDVEVVRKRGYEYYYKGGCMYAAAAALLDTIKEKVGGPWETIPTDMFKYGKGGALSWGTLCGALNGSLAVMSLAMNQDVDTVGNELIGWYTKFPFPSEKMDSFAKFPKQVTTIAESPLCHASVSTWCDEAGAKVNSPEKADRCGKLSGDTAAMAAELLNQWKEGKFTAVYKPDAEFESCITCHQGKDSMLDNEQGKMNCVECHTDQIEPHF